MHENFAVSRLIIDSFHATPIWQTQLTMSGYGTYRLSVELFDRLGQIPKNRSPLQYKCQPVIPMRAKSLEKAAKLATRLRISTRTAFYIITAKNILK